MTLHRIAVNLLYNGHLLPFGHGTRLQLRGLRHTINASGPISDIYFTIPVAAVLEDRYVVVLTLPHPGTGKLFEVVTYVGGKLATDPDLRTPLSPSLPPLAWRTDIEYPRDFTCRCFMLVTAPGTGGHPIPGGRLRANEHLLQTGAAAGVPAAYAHHHRGLLPPGDYSLAFEHQAFALPPSTPSLWLNSTLQVVRVEAQPAATAERFTIRGATFLGEQGQTLVFDTNVPVDAGAAVTWSTANDDILRSAGGGRYLARGVGATDISAAYQVFRASAKVQVRRDESSTVLTPPLPGSIIVEPESGAAIVEGMVVVGVQDDVDATERLVLFAEFGLMLRGSAPGFADQLQYDTRRWSLRDLLTKLNADPRVEFACPDAMLTQARFDSYVPKEFASEISAWHLMHMEAFAAFGLLRKVTREPTTIGFVEAGLHWRNGAFHPDIEGRVDVPLSTFFLGLGALIQAGTAQDLAFNLNNHGTGVVGAAAAGWDNKFGAGVDPAAKIAMFRTPEVPAFMPGTFVGGSIAAAADRVSKQFRILNITTIMEGLGFWWHYQNYAIAKPIRSFARKGGLVVIAAGNQNKPVTDIAVAAIKLALDTAYHDNVIVVGGTETFNPGSGVVSERWAGAAGATEGSNYDTPATQLIDLAAPAAGVFTSSATSGPVPMPDTEPMNGTSFAAPLVSGTASLVWSILPNATAPEVKKILLSTVDSFEKVATWPPPHPAPRLYVDSKRTLGAGRLNVWQAVLAALNTREKQMNSAARYLGIRAATQQQQLQLYLEFAKPKAEPPQQIVAELIAEKSFSIWPHPFFRTRTTVTNRKPDSFPVAIRADRKGPGNTTTTVFRQKLYLDTAAVDKLAPRYVVSCRAFLQGGVTLTAQEPHLGLPANRARVAIVNTGTLPKDNPELLDPQSRNPDDKSIGPWMKLSQGDSYALVATAPEGVTVKFSGHGTDPEGRTFITVPFDGKPLLFEVEGTFGPTAPEQATVVVQAISLNNEIITARTEVRLRAAEQPAADLGCPPGWVFHVDKDFPAGPGAITTSVRPETWKCRHRIELKKQGGGVVVLPITLEFESPPGEVAGAVGVCTLRIGTKAYPHSGRIEMPSLVWICEAPTADAVEPDGAVVKAVFKTKLVNTSRFRMRIREVETNDAFFPAHAPAGDATKLLFHPPSGPPVAAVGLGPGVGLPVTVTILYQRSVLALPVGTFSTRRLRVICEDPWRDPPASSPKYRGVELVLKAAMRLRP